MFVDADKLEKVRDMIDLAVVEISLKYGCRRQDARHRLAESLGYVMHLDQDGDWWIATAVSKSEMDISIKLRHKAGTEAAVAFEAAVRESRQVQADTPESAEIAVLCRLIDPECDIVGNGKAQQ